jgi:hypothetical protein
MLLDEMPHGLGLTVIPVMPRTLELILKLCKRSHLAAGTRGLASPGIGRCAQAATSLLAFESEVGCGPGTRCVGTCLQSTACAAVSGIWYVASVLCAADRYVVVPDME